MATVAPPSARVSRAAQFFARPGDYLDSNYRVPLRAEIVRQLLGRVDRALVVDLGCGDGSISAGLLADHADLTLVDKSAPMLDRAKRRAPAANAIRADLLGFDGAANFDIALCIGVLAHVDSTEAAVAAVCRSLRPGGKAVMQLSDSATLSTRLFRLFRRGYRATSLADVLSVARSLGLRPIASQRHLLLLPGVWRVLGRHLVAWDRFVRRRPWLARHAMDVIVVFERHRKVASADRAGAYANASPFPHAVIEGRFDAARVSEAAAELRVVETAPTRLVYGQALKRGIGDVAKMPPITRGLIEEMNNAGFVCWLQHLTGIDGLVADHGLLGGGVHQVQPGGFLKIHTDFNWHPRLRLYRRVNVLLYLNEDWRDEWGGALELWHPDMSRCGARIAPALGRMVIFSTTDESYHGHPDPLRCPEGVTRNSIALYYYSPEPAPSRFGRTELVNFRERPGERFVSAKHKAHQALIRTGLGSLVMRLRHRS